MKVVVVGTGHVGLVTCASLAEMGHVVVGMDADDGKIASLESGVMPFHEPGLEDLVLGAVGSGRLTFTTDASSAYEDADVVFICVGTPPRLNGEANLVFVEHAVRDVAAHARGRTLIVEKSTVPAGTAQRVRRTLMMASSGRDVELDVASNPEFLREGRAVHDAMHPDRILVGAETDWAIAMLRELYAPLVAQGVPMIETDIATAELAKHASNAFLALKISFANALARVCERAGADVVSVADVMGADPRIGRAFLDAGLGYGGSCFPKDIQAFRVLADQVGYDFPLLAEIQRINDEALDATMAKIRHALWNLEGKRILLLGLAFKAGTDDVRESPALALARRLLAAGAELTGYDPTAAASAKEAVPELLVTEDLYLGAEGADAIVIATDWPEFRELDLERLHAALRNPVIVDGRNLLDRDQLRDARFAYYPTGRTPVE